jgi:hypothetical protein
MRNLFLLLTFIFYASFSWAQDSTMQEKKGTISTIRQKLNSSMSNLNQSTDSLKHKQSPDALNLPADSLKQIKWNAQVINQKYDSIQTILGGQHKLTTVTDSLTKHATQPIKKVTHGVDSLQQKAESYIQGKLDSVKQKLNRPLDKVNSNIASLEKRKQRHRSKDR